MRPALARARPAAKLSRGDLSVCVCVACCVTRQFINRTPFTAAAAYAHIYLMSRARAFQTKTLILDV